VTRAVLNQVVALDDRFYVGGEFKRVDFSCNTQFGSYCAQALAQDEGEGLGAVRYHDVGASPRSAEKLIADAEAAETNLLVVIPCGRYRDATYATIARLVESARPRLCLLAGACLPDDPAQILDRSPLVDAVLLGDDPAPLAEVAALARTPGWRAAVSEVSGFAWRRHDGSLTLLPRAPGAAALGRISPSVRQAGLLVTRDRRPGHADRYGKWLIDSSVGCPRKCIYCRTPVISRRQHDWTWRPRTARDMAAELEEVVRAFGVAEFRFQDDNFLMPTAESWQRCRDLAAELKARKLDISFQIMFHVSALTQSDPDVAAAAFAALEAVGLERVFLGTESGDEDTLRYYRKESTVAMNDAALAWLETRPLVVVMGAVCFHPRTTIAQLRNDHAFFRRWVGSIRYAALAPLGTYAHIIPGSELENDIVAGDLRAASEAEFRPADDAAAAALAAMIRFRRPLFSHDWYLFAIRRDLRHWQRTEGPDEITEAVLDQALNRAALAGLDLSMAIIERAAAGASTEGEEREAAQKLFALDHELAKTIDATPFASAMRARLYAEPR